MDISKNNQTAIYVQVQGRVQGVGFRFSALREAQRLSLNGWVRNTSDGDVEAWVEGPPDKLTAFCVWLHKGPPFSRVDKVIEEDVKPRGYKDMRIIY